MATLAWHHSLEVKSARWDSVGEGANLRLHERGGSCVSQRSAHVLGAVVIAMGTHHTRAGVIVIAVLIVAIVGSVLLLDGASTEDLDLTAEDHLEALATDRLLDAGKTRAVAPFVKFTAEGVGLALDEAKLAGSHEAVAARGVDVGDRGVDDRGL